MLKEVMHLDDEEKVRALLMRLGNGLTQVEMYLEEWRKAKKLSSIKKPVIKPKM